MTDTYILDAVRTPIGRYAGALSGVRPDDLAAHVVASVVGRAPDLDPARIDDVYFGDTNAAGEDNRGVARMAVLLAGLPTSVPGVTFNRLCGSGLEAVIGANRAIAVGDASLAVAGGVESMSRAPWVLLKPARGFPAGPETLHSTTLGWRMVNPHMPGDWTVSLGECTELLAEKYGITREQQDAFAVASHHKAHTAWEAGRYDAEVVAVPRADLARDEGIRPGSSTESLAALKPAFRPDGLGWGDLAAVELNEAFAAQSLACLADWSDLDPSIVNVDGGAIAIGHPLGCSGARIRAHLAHVLHRRGGGYGLAAICIGVGQGLAMVLEAA